MSQSIYQYDQYHLKRQVFALTGKVRIFAPDGTLLLFSEQKMFRLREDINVYSDQQKSNLLLNIKARQIIDFSAAYDVIDTASGQKCGVLRRKGLRSLLRDSWEVLDAQENLIGVLQEDSQGLALMRRLLGGLIPQNYDLLVPDGRRVVDIRQPFNPFRYELNLYFESGLNFDRRLGLAAAVLLAIIEGRQE